MAYTLTADKFNPVAKRLDNLTRPLLVQIDSAIDDITGEIRYEHGGFLGFRGTDDELSDIRPATNEECASIKVEWFRTEATLDLRLNLTRQIAQWLRDEAALMLAAADAVEAIDDTRNLNRIVAIVGSVKS